MSTFGYTLSKINFVKLKNQFLLMLKSFINIILERKNYLQLCAKIGRQWSWYKWPWKWIEPFDDGGQRPGGPRERLLNLNCTVRNFSCDVWGLNLVLETREKRLIKAITASLKLLLTTVYRFSGSHTFSEMVPSFSE